MLHFVTIHLCRHLALIVTSYRTIYGSATRDKPPLVSTGVEDACVLSRWPGRGERSDPVGRLLVRGKGFTQDARLLPRWSKIAVEGRIL